MPSIYERIGADKVEQLVAAFYARVDKDPVIAHFRAFGLSCFRVCFLEVISSA
jgi:truncated hemoglobin YjbI